MPKFRDIKRMTRANYNVNISWKYLEEWLKSNQVDLNPDFQREYVWTPLQKQQYIEWILRGGHSGKDIYFNHPGWMTDFKGSMVIVDGKQRVQAVLDFLYNHVKAYDYLYHEYEDSLNIIDQDFHVHVADLKSREKVLQWYIDMNTGGTVHTDEEIKKVKSLLNEEKN